MSLKENILIGQSGEIWRDTINRNFDNVTRYTPNEILALDTAQINALTTDYISMGKRVFDISIRQMKMWNGTLWVVVPDITVGATQPVDGIWIDIS